MTNFIKRLYRKILPIQDAREELLNLLPKKAIGAEIGTWKGDFTEKLLSHTKPNKLFLIDPYLYVPNYENAWYGGEKSDQMHMDQIFESVNNRFRTEINQHRVEIIRSDSIQAKNHFKDASLDFVYIDGNHLYEFVKNDLSNYWGKVKTNGLITGDDYAIEGWWKDGVTVAVDEFIAEKKDCLEVLYLKNSQFVLKKLKN